MAELADFSHWNTEPDWHRLRLAGLAGVYLALGDGARYADPTFHPRAVRAREAGLRVGGYYFARPTRWNAIEEAGRLCSLLGKLERHDLAPLLDLEVSAALGTGETAWAWVHAFNQFVEAHAGALPAFYSNVYRIGQYAFPRPVGRALVLASYGPDDGTRHDTPAPHPWRHWQAQQYTSRGQIGGAVGNTDRIYARSLRPLLAFPLQGGF